MSERRPLRHHRGEQEEVQAVQVRGVSEGGDEAGVGARRESVSEEVQEDDTEAAGGSYGGKGKEDVLLRAVLH